MPTAETIKAFAIHNRRWLQPLAATLDVVGIIFFGVTSIANWYYGSFRQKVTVNVETPDGIKSGYSVVEIYVHREIGPSANDFAGGMSGESVVVEVAPGKYLFGLISGFPYADSVYFRNVDPVKAAHDLDPDLAPRALGRTAIKQYFTFLDINDPDSLRLVDPANLSDWFGPGANVKNVVIEITDEEVTEGKLIKLLGWWTKQFGDRGWMRPLFYEDPKYPGVQQATSSGSFWSLDRLPVKGR